ncbi:pimeloyl-ACP methyl ester esterase BioH [Pseudoalteromonas phenolica]|uniref:pimeloyl-ACP methyl ester esterase BioH n=1 Tax=Pseudoalteromonas phenolica TaxID=161398 RepID=UPI00384A510B
MQKETVLLHGWGMNRQVWQLIEEELKSEVSCLVKSIDLPGFGHGAMPEAPYSLATAAQLVAEQLADNTTLVGWSLGGLFALHLAKYYPQKVNKVVLIASTPYFAEAEGWAGIKVEVLKNFKAQLKENSAKTIERFLAIQAMGSEHAKADVKQLKAWLLNAPEANPDALSTGLDILLNDDYRDIFSSLTQPVYGLFGKLDSLVPRRAITKMSALNSNFQVEILPKASHAPFISHRAESLNFLKSVL